jgi:hypothetical protein
LASIKGFAMKINITKKQLGDMCRQFKWKGHSRLKKADLVDFVGQHREAAVKIQKWYHKHKGKFAMYRIINDTDFVTLEKIDSLVVFSIRNHARKQIFRFDPKSLMQFFLKTGQFINPFNREPIKDTDLVRLHSSYMNIYKNKSDLLTYTIGDITYRISLHTNIVAVKHALSSFLRAEREREGVGVYLEGNCQDIIDIIMDMIVNLPSFDEDVITQVMSYIINFHFTQYMENFEILIQFNASVARESLMASIGKFSQIAHDTNNKQLIRSISKAVGKLFRRHYNQIFM